MAASKTAKSIPFLLADKEMRRLAVNYYVEKGIIPVKHLTDAAHIAITTVNDIDIIASYNFSTS